MVLAYPFRALGWLTLAALVGGCSAKIVPATGSGTLMCPDVDAGLEDNGLGPGQSLAQGTASGEVSCTLCTLGAIVLVQNGRPSLDIRPNAKFQESSWDSARTSVETCTTPSAFSYLDFAGGVTLPAAEPGTYEGSGPGAQCAGASSADFLVLSYYPAGTSFPDCQGQSGPGCPEGCTSGCIDMGDGGTICGSCSPSISQPPTDYQLYTGCTDGSPTLGSWTATLTSVEPIAPLGTGAGTTPAYQVHGSLTAHLVLSNGVGSTLDGASSPSVTVSVSF